LWVSSRMDIFVNPVIQKIGCSLRHDALLG
jgi:hypothetical protein